jgi:hypothetical protein
MESREVQCEFRKIQSGFVSFRKIRHRRGSLNKSRAGPDSAILVDGSLFDHANFDVRIPIDRSSSLPSPATVAEAAEEEASSLRHPCIVLGLMTTSHSKKRPFSESPKVSSTASARELRRCRMKKSSSHRSNEVLAPDISIQKVRGLLTSTSNIDGDTGAAAPASAVLTKPTSLIQPASRHDVIVTRPASSPATNLAELTAPKTCKDGLAALLNYKEPSNKEVPRERHRTVPKGPPQEQAPSGATQNDVFTAIGTIESATTTTSGLFCPTDATDTFSRHKSTVRSAPPKNRREDAKAPPPQRRKESPVEQVDKSDVQQTKADQPVGGSACTRTSNPNSMGGTTDVHRRTSQNDDDSHQDAHHGHLLDRLPGSHTGVVVLSNATKASTSNNLMAELGDPFNDKHPSFEESAVSVDSGNDTFHPAVLGSGPGAVSVSSPNLAAALPTKKCNDGKGHLLSGKGPCFKVVASGTVQNAAELTTENRLNAAAAATTTTTTFTTSTSKNAINHQDSTPPKQAGARKGRTIASVSDRVLRPRTGGAASSNSPKATPAKTKTTRQAKAGGASLSAETAQKPSSKRDAPAADAPSCSKPNKKSNKTSRPKPSPPMPSQPKPASSTSPKATPAKKKTTRQAKAGGASLPAGTARKPSSNRDASAADAAPSCRTMNKKREETSHPKPSQPRQPRPPRQPKPLEIGQLGYAYCKTQLVRCYVGDVDPKRKMHFFSALVVSNLLRNNFIEVVRSIRARCDVRQGGGGIVHGAFLLV